MNVQIEELIAMKYIELNKIQEEINSLINKNTNDKAFERVRDAYYFNLSNKITPYRNRIRKYRIGDKLYELRKNEYYAERELAKQKLQDFDNYFQYVNSNSYTTFN